MLGGGDLTLSALLDLLMVAFGAAGMDGAVRNQAAATGTQPVPYIGQLLNRYLETALNAVLPAVWGKRISDGLSILSNGTLYLNSDATAAVADFQRWAWQTDGGNLVEFANIGEGNELEGAGYTAIRFSPTDEVQQYTYTVYLDMDIPFDTNYEAGGSDAHYVCFASPVSVAYFTLTWSRYQSYQVWVYVPTPALAGITYYMAGTGTWANSRANQSVNSGEWTVLSNYGAIGGSADYPIGPAPATTPIPDVSDMVAASGGVVGDVDTFVGPMEQGQGTQLPLGDVVMVSSDTAATMHLLNYLRAAAAAYAGTGTAQVPVTDVDTGEDELLPLTVPLDTPIGVTGVTDTVIDQSGAVAGTDAVAGDFAGTDDFTMDLTQFFPFCIPFDIYALYAKFEAEAEAPVIDWPIPIPGQEEPSTIHLDFSVFDSLAVWVRRLELIAFAVGLMFLTKHLIQGGD